MSDTHSGITFELTQQQVWDIYQQMLNGPMPPIQPPPDPIAAPPVSHNKPKVA